MKKVLLSSVYLFAFLSLVLSSCDKEESEEPETKPSASMSALIDSVSWSADQSGGTVTNGILGVAGTKAQGQTITLTVSQLGLGGFGFDNQSTINVASVIDGNVTYTTNSAQGCHGQMYISEINETDSVISGIFSFKAYSPFGKGFIEVTEGTFSNLPYTAQLPATSDNNLVVDIDGSTFTPSSVNAMVAMGKITISASDGQITQTVGITVNEDIEIGTYDMGGMFGSVIGQYNLGTTVIMIANEGEMIITKHDMGNNILEGTFEFEASEMIGTNSASLTNGSFVVNY